MLDWAKRHWKSAFFVSLAKRSRQNGTLGTGKVLRKSSFRVRATRTLYIMNSTGELRPSTSGEGAPANLGQSRLLLADISDRAWKICLDTQLFINSPARWLAVIG